MTIGVANVTPQAQQMVVENGHMTSVAEELADNELERARIQALYSRTSSGESEFGNIGSTSYLVSAANGLRNLLSSRTPQATIECRDDRTICVRTKKSGNPHPKTLKLCDPDLPTTPFWINLVIACDGPTDTQGSSETIQKSKSSTKLPNALKDLTALSEFYRPMMVGSPFVALPLGVTRSVGYFSKTVVLPNPTQKEVFEAISLLLHWVNVNSDDPEFDYFQFNILFSGHADRGKTRGDSAIYLNNKKLKVRDIVGQILRELDRNSVECRQGVIDLFIDACYATAVARDFVVCLQRLQDDSRMNPQRPKLVCHRLFCSSLDDEESFDDKTIDHSYFTAGYLRENSSSRARRGWPALHDVGLRTKFQQNPLMMEFSGKGIRWRLPSFVHLTDEAKSYLCSKDASDQALENILREIEPSADGYYDVHVMDQTISLISLTRDACRNPRNRRSDYEMNVVQYEDRNTRWDF